MAFSSFGKNKRLCLLVLIILSAGFAYQMLREEPVASPAELPTADKQSQTPEELSADPVIANAKRELMRAQKILEAGAELPQDISSSPATTAWRIGDATITPGMPLPAGVSVYEPVSVDMENPAYPEPGEQVSVTVPGGEQLKVNVEGSTISPNGDYTWRGHLDGAGGDEYPVLMTYGGNSVFATVTTPKGSYTLESVNGSGWIYKNPAEFELSHPGVDDSLEIPHEHQ